MLFYNLLILGASVAVVSSRSIGGMIPHINIPSPFHSYTNKHSSPALITATSSRQCLFSPHYPLQRTQNPASIPLHAWPHISSLLASHSNLIQPPSKSSVQTLRLAELTDDSSLEGVVLGLVYTLPAHPADRNELRDVGLRRKEEDNEETCLEHAMKSVEINRQMEGVLEFEGRGKVGFLVYRQD